jgi:uncharacterized protein
MVKNAVCHIEWHVTDFDTTQTFYGGLFGWSFQPWGEDYLMYIGPEGGINGGFVKVPEVKAASSPTVYVLVDEIEPYLAKVNNLGGEVSEGITEIPEIGWFAIVKDPSGNAVALFQARE